MINDLIVRALSVGAGGKRGTGPPSSSHGTSSKFGSKGGGYGFADGFDSIEEGGDTETVELQASAISHPTPTPSAAGRRRVNLGRKKLD
jgi:hypothetical protein